MWLFWLLSILIGALAVAVSVFVMSHNQYALYEATHNNGLTALVDTLPYLWLVVFGLMSAFAIYNLRHTSHGYRYPVWYIISSSVVLSFAGGSALQMFGLGYVVDDTLGNNVKSYMSQEKVEKVMWQSPEDGRLLGKQVLDTVSPTTTVIFEDDSGERWTMNVSDLNEKERDLLKSEQKVKIVGITDDGSLRFHACGAFMSMMNKEITNRQMREQREKFVDRMVEYKEKRAVEISDPRSMEFATSTREEKLEKCQKLAAIQRMP